MTTALIGVIVLILLIISVVPNYRAMKSPICTVKNMAPKMIPIINAIGKVVPSLILRSGEFILYLVGRTIIATLAFILICLTVFTIINSPERKIKLGTTLPIALIIGIIQINVAITPMINPVMTPICTVKNMAPKMIPIINAIGKVFNGTNRCHHWVNHRCDCYVYLGID
jgi:hypothetical protein